MVEEFMLDQQWLDENLPELQPGVQGHGATCEWLMQECSHFALRLPISHCLSWCPLVFDTLVPINTDIHTSRCLS